MRKDGFRRPDEAALQGVLEKNRGSVAETILRLAWNLGLFREEIHQLTWNDISFEETLVRLPERTVPMDGEVQRCLRERHAQRGHLSPFVVTSDRNRKPMAPQSIARVARAALDEGGLTDINLVDLRHDFTIRQLQLHDWPYVARISGITVASLYSIYGRYLPRGEKPASGERPGSAVPARVDEFEMWKLLQAEGDSSVGIAIWMAWKLGMQMKEIVDLTWTQADLKNGTIRLPDRSLPMGATLRRRLTQVWESRTSADDPHVLLTPRSHQPYDHTRLSRAVRTALIRGGMETLTLRDLVREEKRSWEDTLILRRAEDQGNISRNEVMGLLQVSKVPAYSRLNRLVEEGKLTRVGAKYYPAGTAVSPEEHYRVIRAHLEQVGSAYRQELAELLRIEGRQCQTILRRMVRKGQLVCSGQQYALPS